MRCRHCTACSSVQWNAAPMAASTTAAAAHGCDGLWWCGSESPKGEYFGSVTNRVWMSDHPSVTFYASEAVSSKHQCHTSRNHTSSNQTSRNHTSRNHTSRNHTSSNHTSSNHTSRKRRPGRNKQNVQAKVDRLWSPGQGHLAQSLVHPMFSCPMCRLLLMLVWLQDAHALVEPTHHA